MSEELGRLERRLTRAQAAREEAETIAERVIGEQYQLLNELAASRAVLDETPDFVAVIDERGRGSYVNPALREMLGIDPDTPATSIEIPAFLTPLSRERYRDEALPTLADKGVWRGEFALVGPTGVEIPVSQVLIAHTNVMGAVQSISFVARDVTEQRNLTDLLAHRSLHDALTGLPNRRLLLDRLDVAAARAARNGDALAVLFVDLDSFKEVNDEHGHDVGDAVLVAVADRLLASMRGADTLARVGGDEFVVLCESVGDESDADDIAVRMVAALTAAVEVRGLSLQLGCSVGVAFSRGHAVSPHALVKHADAAMYEAKQAGKGRHRLVVIEGTR